MLNKYERPNFKVHAKSYNELRERQHMLDGHTHGPPIRKIVLSLYTAVAVCGFLFMMTAVRLGVFEFFGQPLRQAECVVINREVAGEAYTLTLTIRDGGSRPIESRVEVEPQSWSSVAIGDTLDVAYRRNKKATRALVEELSHQWTAGKDAS